MKTYYNGIEEQVYFHKILNWEQQLNNMFLIVNYKMYYFVTIFECSVPRKSIQVSTNTPTCIIDIDHSHIVSIRPGWAHSQRRVGVNITIPLHWPSCEHEHTADLYFFFFFFFLISYFTWVFIQVLSPVLPWSPGPECTEQCDCRDGFSLLICSELHISNGR